MMCKVVHGSGIEEFTVMSAFVCCSPFLCCVELLRKLLTSVGLISLGGRCT